MRALPIRPKSYGQLRQESGPSLPGQPEQIPVVFYDTQLYTSGTTTSMSFFASVSNDKTVSNMVNAGQFPSPQYFQWFDWGVDVLQDATTQAGGETGIIDDIQKLVLVSRAYAEFTLSDKQYGKVPLSFLHASGGATGFGWGTFTAEESIQFGNNGVFDGGWSWNGAIIIPPNTGFTITLTFAAAQTLQSGNTKLRMWMRGLIDRKVL